MYKIASTKIFQQGQYIGHYGQQNERARFRAVGGVAESPARACGGRGQERSRTAAGERAGAEIGDALNQAVRGGHREIATDLSAGNLLAS